MAKQRRSEHGPIVGGRLRLEREVRDIIRTYTRMKIFQARMEVGRAKAAHGRMQTEQSAGQLLYAEHILAWLEGLYAQGQHSVHPIDWDLAWKHVTVVERHTLGNSTDQQTIPGM